MKKLDFIIIGAQKSATTSLYKYLHPHEQIFMSSTKEAPFFSRDDLYQDGWEEFVATYFEGADENRLWGTASPQYMGDSRAAARIHAMMPETKLIAILRNPLERTYSHYTMAVRRGLEHRSFDQALDELLKTSALKEARTSMPVADDKTGDEDETGHYVAWSEYGRIINQFLKFFPKEQLLVLYMDDLMKNPGGVYQQVLEFIGIKGRQDVPANVGKVYHQGGTRRIIPDSWRQYFKQNGLFRLFWDKVPENLRERIRYTYEQKNIRKGSGNEGPSTAARARLIQHFAADMSRLESITGHPLPWSEFQPAQQAFSQKEVTQINNLKNEIRIQA